MIGEGKGAETKERTAKEKLKTAKRKESGNNNKQAKKGI